jgi:hypothetical protein
MESFQDHLNIFALLEDTISGKLITQLIYDKIVQSPESWKQAEEYIQEAIQQGKGEDAKRLFIIADYFRIESIADSYRDLEETKDLSPSLESFLYALVGSIDLYELSKKLLLHYKELQKTKKKVNLKAA